MSEKCHVGNMSCQVIVVGQRLCQEIGCQEVVCHWFLVPTQILFLVAKLQGHKLLLKN
jgi:hypothetical protein